MKKLFTLLYSSLFISCSAQNKHLEVESDNPIGIGILEIISHEPLNVYPSKVLDEVFDTITFDKIYFGDNSGSVEINSSILKTKLKPYALSASSSSQSSKKLISQGLGGYGTTLKFRVIESNAKYFKVILNETTKEIGYIKIEESPKKRHNYESWEHYLQRVQMIHVNDKASIYDQPNGIKINVIDNQCYLKVVDVKNEWVKIKPAEGIVGNEKYQDKKGWIKWRNNNTIFIEIIVRTID
jgi:hypothetical protein